MKEYFGLRLTMVVMVLGTGIIGYSMGKDAGYNRALEDVALITPPTKTTDQQCVAWLFDSNMKDVKKRICK